MLQVPDWEWEGAGRGRAGGKEKMGELRRTPWWKKRLGRREEGKKKKKETREGEKEGGEGEAEGKSEKLGRKRKE